MSIDFALELWTRNAIASKVQKRYTACINQARYMMNESMVTLKIPMRVYAALQQLADQKHSDPVGVLEQMLDVEPAEDVAVKPKNKLQELLLQGPTLTDEELAEYDRIRQ